jgi:alpha-glucoside transport system permease protein
VTVANLIGSQGQGQELLAAGAVVSLALPVAVFFALQRYFVRGIVAGAVKG